MGAGWALRVSYAGELGWELWVPTEFAVDLHDKVVAAGAGHGLRHAGFLAFDALRLERGFRSWGHDMGRLDDPYQCGLGFTVAAGTRAPTSSAARRWRSVREGRSTGGWCP